jgi:hypothetical protein
VIFRFGPVAVVTLIAGVIATLTRRNRRDERAMAVLTLLHTPTRRGARRVRDA